MSKYTHLFFDLDHTLWDFETNSRLTLEELYAALKLEELGVPPFERFHSVYLTINAQYWARFHQGVANKEQLRVGRFRDTLRYFGVYHRDIAEQLATRYLDLSPYRSALFPDTIETLEYLLPRYEMHLITNGFAEVQHIKVEHSGLKRFFKHVFVSEEVGHQKPKPEIFHHALSTTGGTAGAALMIGDSYQTDIIGAQNAGIDQVLFNPLRKRVSGPTTYEIHHLAELRGFL